MPLSCADYPGKVGAVIFFGGCNLRCGFCHNSHLVLLSKMAQSPVIDEGYVLDYLRKKSRWLDGVVLSGGEALIHDSIPEFAKKIKEIGLNICVETNGHYPEALKNMMDQGLVDFVAMDIKGPLNNDFYRKIVGSNGDVAKVKKTIELIKKSKTDHEFRITVVPTVHQSEMIQDLIEEYGPFLKLQKFRNISTLDPKYEKIAEFSEDELKNWPGYQNNVINKQIPLQGKAV